MCLPSLFSFSAPLIDWPESDLKLLTAVWVRAYKNAWNLGKSTATCLFTFPRKKDGLQVKLPLGTLFTSVWGNLERYSQFDDGTRQMLAICYQEALQENECLDLLELQDTSQHLSWKTASTNEVTFAFFLALCTTYGESGIHSIQISLHPLQMLLWQPSLAKLSSPCQYRSKER